MKKCSLNRLSLGDCFSFVDKPGTFQIIGFCSGPNGRVARFKRLDNPVLECPSSLVVKIVSRS